MITITVQETPERHGRFEARLDKQILCTSRTPLLTSARRLIGLGHDPGEAIEMRHASRPDEMALRSTLGAAAKLKVSDASGTKFRPYPKSGEFDGEDSE